MMKLVQTPPVPPGPPPLQDVIDRFGAWRVLLAALAALLWRRPVVPRPAARRAVPLSAHISRDIGLPPPGSAPQQDPRTMRLPHLF
ncbi:hypothetical protein [Puniceibacterium sediminis]|uniref:Uncharacterized protein n=1 Tax=Puniceibacterium sediminis TaxID=1608407 RepID=A0A238X621_9RHOB|nr:hypothetical protein [Puniceibacterium sediminis]SNR54130.1 hypothetical protein SAMN06265370_10987 [Puniceibacterium sediminis]